MKTVLTMYCAIFATCSFALPVANPTPNLSAISGITECEGLELTAEQTAEIEGIFRRARAAGETLRERASAIHDAYAANVTSEEGSSEEARRIGKQAIRLGKAATALKVRVVNAILFGVMDGVEQRTIAAGCMHEHEGGEY